MDNYGNNKSICTSEYCRKLRMSYTDQREFGYDKDILTIILKTCKYFMECKTFVMDLLMRSYQYHDLLYSSSKSINHILHFWNYRFESIYIISILIRMD